MKAAVLTGIREMEIRDFPEPTLKNDDDVLLKIEMIGICGSDVHYYTTGRIGSQIVEYPFIVGHECCAVVAAIGKAVKGLSEGQRVAVDPAVSCLECDQCRKGRAHTCRKLKFLGCPGQLGGCLCEYLVLPERCCYPISENISNEDAVLSEPLTIGVYAVDRAGEMAGKNIAILGSGPVGLSVLLAAKAAGAAAIYVSEPIAARRKAACLAGAEYAANSGKEDTVKTMLEKCPQQLDAVFECAGEQETFDQACELLAPGGKLMLIGIPEFPRYSFAADTARRRELCILHVRRQNEKVAKTLSLMQNKTIKPGFMATHYFTLAETKAGFELVSQYADGVIKAMVTI